MSLYRLWTHQNRRPVERAAADGDRLPLIEVHDLAQREQPQQVGRSYEHYLREGFEVSGSVWTAETHRLSLFTQGRPVWRDWTSNNPEATRAGLELLEQPRPGGTIDDILAEMLIDRDFGGAALVVRRAGQLQVLRPDWVYAVRVRAGVWDFVYVVDGLLTAALEDTGRLEVFLREDVAYWCPVPNRRIPPLGLPWLTSVVNEINAETARTRFRRNYFDRGAVPGLLASYEGNTPGMLKKLRAVFKELLERPENAGRTAVFAGDVKIHNIGSTMKDAAMAELDSIDPSRIMAAAHVPTALAGLGLMAGATVINPSDEMVRFASQTIRPLWSSAFRALERLTVAPAPNLYLGFTDAHISALQTDENRVAETQLTLGRAARTWLMGGYEPESVQRYLSSGDLRELEHTGWLPTTLHRPGTEPPPANNDGGDDNGENMGDRPNTPPAGFGAGGQSEREPQ